MKNQLSAQFIINESLQAIADEPALQAQERREFLQPLYDRLFQADYIQSQEYITEKILNR